MITRHLRALAWSTALACLALPGMAVAQQPLPPGMGPAPDQPSRSSRDDRYVPEFKVPENWSIKTEVRTLERSLSKYDPLLESLGEANTDLQKDLEAYLRNPKDQVLASRIAMKMSAYAKKVAWDFDRVVANQDVLINVFKELRRKLTKFNGYLDFRARSFDTSVANFKAKGKTLGKELNELATAYMEAEDDVDKDRRKREFTRVYRRYKINKRYVEGYRRTRRSYANLSRNLTALIKIFSQLQEAYSDLIDNLEAEKKFLMDNIRLQADSLQVQNLVRNGILHGNIAIKQITEKLARMYLQVNTFAQVHDRINAGMSKFIDTHELLVDVTQKIESQPFGSNPSIEKAIDHFYRKYDYEREGEEELEKKTEEAK